ncbi:MAG: DUF975 family protein [Lachnospiraceae bacterium]|nr:DUF975 family protein [Lachnospiraceae bacterium]
MNWSISQVKLRGKATLKAGYWKCVLVAFIITLISGGVGSVPNFSGSYNINSVKDENGNFDFSAIYDSSADTEAIEELAEEIANSPSFGVIVGTLIVILIVAMLISIALNIFLIEPLAVGCRKFFMDAGRTRRYELGSIGFAFSKNYMNIVKIMFLYTLKILLWTLLLIIPGIIKLYEYRMIPYIISDNPGISSEEAFRISREMMKGNKWHSFLFDLSFIGWIFLSLFTCGILLVFYVNPYISASDAELYLTLKGEPAAAGFDNNGYNSFSGNPYANGQYGSYSGSSTYGKSQYYDNTGRPYDGNTYGTAPYSTDSPVSGRSSYGQSSYEDSPAADGSGYTDSEYRELKADADMPEDTSSANNNTRSDNDRPFNTPY